MKLPIARITIESYAANEPFHGHKRSESGRNGRIRGGIWIIGHIGINSRHMLVLAVCFLAVVGCGGRDFVPIHGSVTYRGQPVDAGVVSFVPVEGASGPVGRARIETGRYQMKARGGVPVGSHRVEVLAQKKTGRTVTEAGKDGTDLVIDELVQVGPAAYAGSQSPLTFEVKAGGDGRFNIDLPAVETSSTRPY